MKLSKDHFLELSALCYEVTEKTDYRAEISPHGLLFWRHPWIENDRLSFTVFDRLPEEANFFQPEADVTFHKARLALENLLRERKAA